MTNIKASRKGTRLNDVRYFLHPLSHTRKKMTIIHVIPRIVNLESSCLHVVQDPTNLHPALGIARKPRDRGKMIESKQSSVEIAFMTCHNWENNQNEEKHQDICVETEVVLPSNRSSLTEEENVSPIVSQSSKRSVEFQQIEDDEKSVEEIRTTEKDEREQNCGNHAVETEKQEKTANWWKDSGQTILQFFSKILGRRGGMAAKGATHPRVLPIGKRVRRASRDGRSHNRHRRGIDEGIRLRRVSNGYIATQTYRDEEENRRDSVAAENKSREEQQQCPSILVRQIQRTRDKNLRVVLLERELRVRLPNIARKDIRSIANGAVNIRQFSSPLC